MARSTYPSDLSDREWQLLESLLPPPKPGGRPVKYPRRGILNHSLRAAHLVAPGGCWHASASGRPATSPTCRELALLPPPKPGGRPVKYPRRGIVNAIRYVLRTGCAWRMLPHDLPPWRIAFHYFRTWRRDGTWQRANDTLHSSLRQAQGCLASPSAAIIDSQSVAVSR